MLMFMVLVGFLLVLLGSVRLSLSSLMSVGHSAGYSGHSWNLLTFCEVVGGPRVSLDFHLVLADFTADREHSSLQ